MSLFTFGVIAYHELRAGDMRFIDLQSCRNYPYKEGINFLRKKNNSFQLYSTSKAYLKYGRQTLSSLEAKEAGLRAKLQIANFIKIANSPNIEDIKFDISKIYTNGRRLRSKLRLKKYLNNTYFGNAKSFQGLISIGMCKDSENYYCGYGLDLVNNVMTYCLSKKDKEYHSCLNYVIEKDMINFGDNFIAAPKSQKPCTDGAGKCIYLSSDDNYFCVPPQ